MRRGKNFSREHFRDTRAHDMKTRENVVRHETMLPPDFFPHCMPLPVGTKTCKVFAIQGCVRARNNFFFFAVKDSSFHLKIISTTRHHRKMALNDRKINNLCVLTIDSYAANNDDEVMNEWSEQEEKLHLN